MFGALTLMAVGLFMLTHLETGTPIPVLWAWMFVTGVGVGPMFAVFPLIVQNNVPVEELGTATSNLTFFQSVGGTVGLALTGTIFATTLAEELPRQLAAGGVPPEVGGALAGGGGLDRITGVGDLGAAILAATPEAARGGRRAVHPGHRRGASTTRCRSRRRRRSRSGSSASVVAAGLVLLLREAPAHAVEPAGARALRNGVTPTAS